MNSAPPNSRASMNPRVPIPALIAVERAIPEIVHEKDLVARWHRRNSGHQKAAVNRQTNRNTGTFHWKVLTKLALTTSNTTHREFEFRVQK